VNAVLETERLILRQWTLADFDEFAAMCGDPEVMRFASQQLHPAGEHAFHSRR
jgi:RimJ/RimL family protein N-acetyltransferase